MPFNEVAVEQFIERTKSDKALTMPSGKLFRNAVDLRVNSKARSASSPFDGDESETNSGSI